MWSRFAVEFASKIPICLSWCSLDTGPGETHRLRVRVRVPQTTEHDRLISRILEVTIMPSLIGDCLLNHSSSWIQTETETESNIIC